jgi:hypothetical protein
MNQQHFYRKMLPLLMAVLATVIMSGLKQCPSQETDILITLDNREMRDLTNEQSQAISLNSAALVLTFSAVNDPIKNAVDDEMYFGLEIRLIDPPKINETISVENNPAVEIKGDVSCFCAPPLESLTTAVGTVIITAYEKETVSGVAEITLTDPAEVNTAVHDNLKFKVNFTHLPVLPKA